VTLVTWALLGLGFVLLAAGAEGLVRGALGLARLAGISPLVAGLTVVAFGTSAPELVVSGFATLAGRDDVAVGNVVGSNVLNVLLILGACAVLRPLVVARQLVTREIPVMITISLLLWFLGLDGRLSFAEGALLCAGLVWFTVDSIRQSRRETAAADSTYAVRAGLGASLAFAGTGLALLVIGARLLVDAAVAIAAAFGIDEAVIALTIVAAGTSLPEVATSVVATLRGERDIAVGNVVGSNIFNVLGILGVSSLLAGGALRVAPALENFDVPVMVATAVACLPLLARGHRLARWEGALFLGYYAAYVAYLVLAAQQHAALPRFSAVMLEFVIPLTIATVIALTLQDRRSARS
jgi:cation:H+ antiporter